MKKSLVQIILANIAYLFLVAATNFLLPMFVSVDTYAATKEYSLYISTYARILTFGYIQGMYLEYGGCDIDKMDPSRVGSSVFSFFILMLPISLLITAYGIWKSDVVLSVVGIGIMASNFSNYYQMFYQATGDFKSYGVALNASRLLLLLAYVLLIFGPKADHALWYVAVSPLVEIIIILYLTIKLNKRIPLISHFKFRLSVVKRSISGGFVLMLGNFVADAFSSIDRWFVKYLLGTFNFAMYSFAVSMERMVTTFMSPVTVSMYHYFCKDPDVEKIREIKNCTLVYSFVVIAAAFPGKWIVEHIMPNYITSTVVMFYLFAAQAISATIRGIYVNKYKAEDQQKKYLEQMVAMLIIAVVLNALFYFLSRNISAIAAATLATNLIWLLICEIENPQLRYDWKAMLSLVILLTVYLWTGCVLNSMLGCIVYCITGLVLGLTLMHDSFLYVLKSVADIAIGRMKKRI